MFRLGTLSVLKSALPEHQLVVITKGNNIFLPLATKSTQESNKYSYRLMQSKEQASLTDKHAIRKFVSGAFYKNRQRITLGSAESFLSKKKKNVSFKLK